MSRKNPTLTSKIARHTTIQVIGRFIGFGLSLISIIFLTRYLGTNGFGQYVTITVFVNAVAVFAEFGLDQIFIKEYYKTPRKKQLLANTFALKIFLALFVFIIGALIGHFFPYASVVKTGIWIYALASFIISVEALFLGIFQINLQMHYQTIAETVNRIITVILVIVAVYLNLGLLFIIFSFALGSTVQFLMTYVWADKIIKIKFDFNFKLWKSILIKAIPLGASSILVFIYYKIDTVILSVLKPSYDVGIYGASYKVLDIVIIFPAMFCGLVFPILANIFAQNKIARFNKIIQKSFDVLAVTGMPITVIMLALARPLILLVAGNQFLPSILVLQILAPTAILIFLNWIFWVALIGGDKQKFLIIPYLFISIFNIGLNLILIPHYSYFGAAISTVVTQFFALIIPWTMTKNYFKTTIKLVIALKTLIAGIIMFIAFYIIQKWDIGINWHNLENINTFGRLLATAGISLLGIAIYLGVLFSLGGINKQIIQKIIRA